jgi:hypothetical protein
MLESVFSVVLTPLISVIAYVAFAGVLVQGAREGGQLARLPRGVAVHPCGL